MSDAVSHLRAFLQAVGFADDPEMERTPELVSEFLSGFVPPAEPEKIDTLPTTSRDPVVLHDLHFHSLCAHHLLPFFGTVSIAYMPAGSITGLGSLVRALHHFAQRPQLQERLTAQLADHIHAELSALAVVVHMEARQMCMEMRGARNTGTVITTATRGNSSVGERLEKLIRG